jgi:hypothetical protein
MLYSLEAADDSAELSSFLGIVKSQIHGRSGPADYLCGTGHGSIHHDFSDNRPALVLCAQDAFGRKTNTVQNNLALFIPSDRLSLLTVKASAPESTRKRLPLCRVLFFRSPGHDEQFVGQMGIAPLNWICIKFVLRQRKFPFVVQIIQQRVSLTQVSRNIF